MKILVVEDHHQLAAMISEDLGKAGFIVDLTMTGEAAMALLRSNRYDALILDLGLPDMDGMSVLAVAQREEVPCLVLTARDSLQSRLNALNAGADDYILKPFDMPELEARLRAVLRRFGHRSTHSLRFGNLTFDRRNRQLHSPDSTLALAKREAVLLETLLDAAPRVVIKDFLEDTLYGLEEVVSSNAVEALVSRTRRKLTGINASCRIETLRGLGYRLVE